MRRTDPPIDGGKVSAPATGPDLTAARSLARSDQVHPGARVVLILAAIAAVALTYIAVVAFNLEATRTDIAREREALEGDKQLLAAQRDLIEDARARTVEVQRLRGEQQNLQTKLEEVAQKVRLIAKQREEADAALGRLTADRDAAQVALTRDRQELDRLNSEIARLNEQHDLAVQTEQRRQPLLLEIERLDQKKRDLTGEIATLKAEKGPLETALARAQEAQKRVTDLEDSVTKAAAGLTDAAAKARSSAEGLATAAQELEGAKGLVSQNVETTNSAANNLQDAIRSIQAKDSQLGKVATQLQEESTSSLRARVQDLETGAERIKKSADQLHDATAALAQGVPGASDALRSLPEQQRKFDKLLNDLIAELERLQSAPEAAPKKATAPSSPNNH